MLAKIQETFRQAKCKYPGIAIRDMSITFDYARYFTIQLLE